MTVGVILDTVLILGALGAAGKDDDRDSGVVGGGGRSLWLQLFAAS